ncbi:MAG: peptidase domain-containing ABC transporter [Hydrogenophilales bacterium]|nr:peptidase domain-containing ABC transporter [Hydrogenophilales bacterium]
MEKHIGEDSFIWLVGSLCRLHGLPWDEALVHGQYIAPLGLPALHRALDELGLSVREQALGGKRAKPPLPPFIAFEREPSANKVGADSATPALVTGVLIVQTDAERILFFTAGSDTPETLSHADFLARFEPHVLKVERKPAANGQLADPADTLIGRPAFGFKWFIPELMKHKRIWRDVLLASLAIQLLGLGLPIFTQIVIDKVVVHQTYSTLQVVGAGMALFMAFSAVMSWLRQYLLIHTGNRVDAVLGASVFRHLFRLPHAYIQARPTGTLVARLQGIETIREFITGAAVSLILDLPFMLLFLTVMAFYSWQLTLIALALLALVAVLSLLVTPLFRERLDRQFLTGARNQAFLTEYIGGMETVKSLQMEPRLEQRYGDYLGDYLKAGFATRQLGNTYNTLATTMEQAQSLGILVMGALLVMRADGFTVGMLVAFQMFAGRLSQPVLRLVGLYQQFQQTQVAVQRLADIMDAPREPYALAPSRPLGGPGRIEALGLGFRYSEAHPWLYRQLDLVIPPGKAVAIMGPSGCGKSTLAKLLQGFYMPQEGRLKLDGIDTRHLAANELRQYFGVVPQETVLFSGTIYDNLVAAHSTASLDDVVMACKMAEIHDVIEQLPQGYQTPIGERGAGLSGGQKQRLAIARALLKRPRILIFDEATSNLDGPTAEAFARTVNQLRGTATLLFIAHQLPRGLEVDGMIDLGPRTVSTAQVRAGGQA